MDGVGNNKGATEILSLWCTEKAPHKSFMDSILAASGGGGTLSHWPLFIDLEYPTLYPVHENPYVVSNSEGGGYVEANQPFHDNIYSGSSRVTPVPVLTENIIISIAIIGIGQALLRIRQHIR